MTEISNEAVWRVCEYVTKPDGGKCEQCPETVDCAPYGTGQQMCRALAEQAIYVVQEALKPGLPPGWVRGP